MYHFTSLYVTINHFTTVSLSFTIHNSHFRSLYVTLQHFLSLLREATSTLFFSNHFVSLLYHYYTLHWSVTYYHFHALYTIFVSCVVLVATCAAATSIGVTNRQCWPRPRLTRCRPTDMMTDPLSVYTHSRTPYRTLIPTQGLELTETTLSWQLKALSCSPFTAARSAVRRLASRPLL